MVASAFWELIGQIEDAVGDLAELARLQRAVENTALSTTERGVLLFRLGRYQTDAFAQAARHSLEQLP